jgi:protein-disulfide isomerase
MTTTHTTHTTHANHANHATHDSPSPETPMVALSGADHVVGRADAPLTLLEYGDYECPACMQAEPVTQHLVQSFGDRMCFVFRHCPLVEAHPHAELAAEAAEAAAAQGQFWAMHHLLFLQAHHLKLPALAGYAESLGLDMRRFNGEMADRIYTQRVQEHRRAAEHTGVRTTPAFFLNGRVVDVSFGLAHLETTILAALATSTK